MASDMSVPAPAAPAHTDTKGEALAFKVMRLNRPNFFAPLHSGSTVGVRRYRFYKMPAEIPCADLVQNAHVASFCKGVKGLLTSVASDVLSPSSDPRICQLSISRTSAQPNRRSPFPARVRRMYCLHILCRNKPCNSSTIRPDSRAST